MWKITDSDINKILERLSGGTKDYNWNYTEDSIFSLTHRGDVIFTSDDIEEFYAYISFLTQLKEWEPEEISQ